MNVALELLRRLAAEPLPCTIDQPEEIVLLRALRAAGLVQANVPRPLTVGGRPFQLPATAQVVTRSGWEALLAASPPMPLARPMTIRHEPTVARALPRRQPST